ncbi:hypothetical protein [Botrimarina mediterranea]|uniref:Uncharacterized protein n=1 Tax=Botrimarina mediterranea TaxID=2528022 RepID=A0A518K3Y0_9BACT|nr:hypothetical protein [Botrimarina mediterranea]QDV72475.1 hypothetical protein Spa11_06530 [Botrimarina mediterranea]
MQDFVSRKIAGVGWIALDSSRIIACGTEESEICDALESYLGYPVARLEESSVEAFESTLCLAVANTLTQDRGLFESLTQQVASGQTDAIALADVVGLLTNEVRSLSEKNAQLEKQQRYARRRAEVEEYLRAMNTAPQDMTLMTNLILQQEGF